MTKKKINHIVLTTYPEKKSKNVGDKLICESALKILTKRLPEFNPVLKFRGDSLDGFSRKKTQIVFAPGFSVSNNTYPDLYTLFSDLNRLEFFYPVGCSYQNITPSYDAFMQSEFNKETIEFLSFVTRSFGPLPCRDMLIVKMLEDRFNIPAFYSGDMGIYDESKIGLKFLPPKTINSVVFTIQHHPKYLEQSLKLLTLIRSEFPKAKLYVAYHSKPNPLSDRVANFATELGYEVMNQFGNTSNLERYHAIDLHIGYRLHGHIYFLRQRKPSILMVEDARSFGLANTQGTHVGCINAVSDNPSIVDEYAPEKAIEYARHQIKYNFNNYNELFNFVDNTFKNIVTPFFDVVSEKIRIVDE